jgi:hypothetical protein
MTCLVHFVDTPLDFWLRPTQKLEEGGDPWEEFSTLPYPCSNAWDPLTIVSFDMNVHITWLVRFGVLGSGC